MTDYAARRLTMVDTQVRPCDVTKFPVIDAMLRVERELFVPREKREAAYIGENVDLGDQLVFRSGHTRKGARAKAPVDVEVLINGKRLASFSKEPAFNFSAKVLPTASSGEEKATVEFRFKTNNDSRNHFAFDAYTYHAGDAQ